MAVGGATQLPELARLGITVIEMMPVAEFPGRFGWGYDGVNLYRAVPPLRHGPTTCATFVDQAHALGLAVILDVVYNHLGPDGNYLAEFSPDYFTDKYTNDWGRAINFDGRARRRCANSSSPTPATGSTSSTSTACASTPRRTSTTRRPRHVLADDGCRGARRPRAGGAIYHRRPRTSRRTRGSCVHRPRAATASTRCGTTTFTTRAIVALTGRSEAYYTRLPGHAAGVDLRGEVRLPLPGAVLRAGRSNARGTPAFGLPSPAFVNFLENHDQVANSASRRALASARPRPGRYRAMTALLLLGPGTPMLFQGQEFAASAPFLYFADHKPNCAGRYGAAAREFLAQFPSLRDAAGAAGAAVAGDAARRSSAASSISAEREQPRGGLRAAPRSARAAARTIRCSRAGGRAARRRGPRPAKRSCSGYFGGDARTTGC